MKKALAIFIDFLRVWIFMFFTYVMIKTIFNLIFFGWIDLTRAAILEVLFLPFGQSIAFLCVARVRRKDRWNSVR